MPLPNALFQTWIVAAIFATIVVRLLAIGLRDRPRAYARLWYIGAIAFGAASMLLVAQVASIPLFSQRRGSGDPGALPTLGELLSAVVLVIAFRGVVITSVPALLALGLSPPNYHQSRKYWFVGLIPIIASVLIGFALFWLNHRYVEDFRLTKKRQVAQQSMQFAWQNPAPPDPKVGPARYGEWTYLGAIPTYSAGPGSDVVRLQFWSADKLIRPDSFRWLAKETALESLFFQGPITDEDIAWIEPIGTLKQLQLIDSEVTDRGVAELVALRKIEELELINAPITAKSLDYFAQLPALKSVNLTGTEITDDDLRIFIREHPGWKQSRRFNGIEKKN